jgi:hypothetical protein
MAYEVCAGGQKQGRKTHSVCDTRRVGVIGGRAQRVSETLFPLDFRRGMTQVAKEDQETRLHVFLGRARCESIMSCSIADAGVEPTEFREDFAGGRCVLCESRRM